MGNELKLNSAEEAEVILIRLTPEEYPIAYANRVKCLMLSGLSKKEAERMAMKPRMIQSFSIATDWKN